MEKKLIARLNEIGLEVGYPYEVLKNGQCRKSTPDNDKDDVAMVVYDKLQNDSLLSELSPEDEDKKLVWSQLFPRRPSVKDAVLTQQEFAQLILFGRRSTIMNYIGKKNIGDRTARLLVSRNDDELLYKIRSLNHRLPPVVAIACITYMSDNRFVSFITEGAKRGFYQFSPLAEETLIKQGSLTKFKAYIKYFGLKDVSEYVLIKSENPSFLKAYVDAGYTLNSKLEETMSLLPQHKKVYETYLEMKAIREEKNNNQ